MNQPPSQSSSPVAGRALAVVEVGLIFLVFFVHAAWPVPEVNEPYYLGKAKHYWNPDWCGGDFFLQSADAHQAFYWTFGWLTLLLPLPAVAWVGRLATWGLLAWAWRRASWALVEVPLAAVLSAGLFVTLGSRCELAGEWVVGGVEAKGFAYVFVLLAVEAMLAARWRRVWLLLGAASALHVLVGGWSALAAGFVWLTDRQRAPLRSMLPALAGGAALALFGLVPALRLTVGVPADVVNDANQIYVYERLPHHLAPNALPPEELARRLTRSGILLAAFGVLAWIAPGGQPGRRLRMFCLAGILVAAAGLVICYAGDAHRATAAKLLRFYWFRFYDFALPLTVSLLATLLVTSWLPRRPRVGTLALVGCLALVGYHLGRVTYERVVDPRAPADRKLRSADDVAVYEVAPSSEGEADALVEVSPDPRSERALQREAVEDWQNVCRWIAANTPRDARFFTPRISSTFKWYTGRAEVVTQKDIPQDARSIVQWHRRMDDVFGNRDGPEPRYVSSLAHQGAPLLLELGERYDAQYLVERTTRLLPLRRLYRHGSYAVYKLEPAVQIGER